MKKRRKPKQCILQTLGHGGIREGAGRRSLKNGKAKHTTRPEVSDKIPLHITVRFGAGVASLRSKKSYKIFRRGVIRARESQGLRVLHFAILGNHYHLIVESQDKAALARGMKSLNIQLAKGLKKLSGATGAWSAVSDRYDIQFLKTPSQVRHALSYVFANAAKHFKRSQVFDWFCSFAVFEDAVDKLRRGSYKWARPTLSAEQRAWFMEMLNEARSWLARTGWKRACGSG
jgi:REP element-mobilizing transposase RayT